MNIILENIHIIGQGFFALIVITAVAALVITCLDKRDTKRRKLARYRRDESGRIRRYCSDMEYDVRVANSHLN